MSRRLALLYWTMVPVLAICFAVAGAEGVLRWMAVSNAVPAPVQYRNVQGYYTYFPHQTFEFINEDKLHVRVEADEHGLRNRNAVSQTPDVLLLGDSFLAAVNTEEGKTFTSMLAQQRMSVYNAGMDGTGTFQHYYLLRDELVSIRPKIVLVLFYLGNDFRDNY